MVQDHYLAIHQLPTIRVNQESLWGQEGLVGLLDLQCPNNGINCVTMAIYCIWVMWYPRRSGWSHYSSLTWNTRQAWVSFKATYSIQTRKTWFSPISFESEWTWDSRITFFSLKWLSKIANDSVINRLTLGPGGPSSPFSPLKPTSPGIPFDRMAH